MKRIWLAALICATAQWGLAGLWHQLIVPQFYVEARHADHAGTGIIFLAYLVLGGLMACLYSPFHQPHRRWISGIRFGALMGLLWVFPHELAMAGAHGEKLAYVFQNGAWHVVEQGWGGLVLAWIWPKLGD